MIKLNSIEKFYAFYNSESNIKTNQTKKVFGIKNISLDINHKDFIAFVGNTGSGKTTLISIAGLLLKPTKGTVFFNEKKINSLSQVKISLIRRRHFSYILQSTLLFNNMNILENLLFPITLFRKIKKTDIEYVRTLADILQMHTPLNSPVSNLSCGEEKKCSVIRGLVKPSDILIADEPAASLDEKSATLVLDLFKKENKAGRTIIMVTHDQNHAVNCKTIYNLINGEISECVK